MYNEDSERKGLLGMKSKNKVQIQNNTIAFQKIITIIERARENAFRAVNHEFISMYWEIGGFSSVKKLKPITGGSLL